jgi:hypothetical protein
VLTIAASARILRADYGVKQLDGAGAGADRVQGCDEKSETQVVSIPAGGLLGAKVHNGYWRDIGRHGDSEDAQAEIDALLPELQLA